MEWHVQQTRYVKEKDIKEEQDWKGIISEKLL
jgi:hypothetical protein